MVLSVYHIFIKVVAKLYYNLYTITSVHDPREENIGIIIYFVIYDRRGRIYIT